MLSRRIFRPTVSRCIPKASFHSGWKGFDPDFRKKVDAAAFQPTRDIFEALETHAISVLVTDKLLDESKVAQDKWYNFEQHCRLKGEIAALARTSEEFIESLLDVDREMKRLHDRLAVEEKGEK
jgi:hypothetical protein